MERRQGMSCAGVVGSLAAVFAAGACSGGSGGGDASACTSGAVEGCYSGPAGTSGVGTCHGGTRTCAGGTWGACVGEVTPAADACGNGIDEDCDGIADDSLDEDGDGFTVCAGDCCDAAGQGCPTPALVNPGAFDVPGNLVDDDCDGVVDQPLVTCDAGLASNSGEPLDYAKALDLCQATTLADRTWGILSARLVKADGADGPAAAQHAIRPDFGATAVRAGAAMAVLSTGHAADLGDTNPSFAAFEAGSDMGHTAAFPADWYAANGNALPSAPGCPTPAGVGANDSVLLELTIRAPTNARSFAFDANFFSAEYPEWTCSAYNDFFVVLLDSLWSGVPANPADGNLAVHGAVPVGVNLAAGDTGLFTACENGPIGCAAGATAGTISTCSGTAALAGTGFDLLGTACGTNDLVGGGTGWLTVRGNVLGGEVITLRIALWDTGDALYDSLALLDGFRWSVDAAVPGAEN